MSAISGTYGFDLDGNETASGTGLAGGATRTSTWTNTDQNSTVTVGSGEALANTYLGASNSYLSTTKLNSADTETLRNSFTGVSAVVVNSGTTTYVHREPSGKINSFQTSDGAHYYPFTDNLGSILFVVDATSATNGAYTYQPYGTQTVTTAPTFTQPFGYTGAYTDASTGLLHLSARYYDPSLGRFTQPDPSGQNPGYVYAGNNPISNIDPSGLNLFDDITSGISAVAGAVATVADATGVGAPVGLIAGGVATVSASVKAVGDCAGTGDDNCGTSIASAAITAGSFGLAASAGEGSLGQIAGDVAGNSNDAREYEDRYGE